MVQIHLGPHKLSSVVKMQDAEERFVSASVGATLCTDRPISMFTRLFAGPSVRLECQDAGNRLNLG
jgi:hypothetical protein